MRVWKKCAVDCRSDILVILVIVSSSISEAELIIKTFDHHVDNGLEDELVLTKGRQLAIFYKDQESWVSRTKHLPLRLNTWRFHLSVYRSAE